MVKYIYLNNSRTIIFQFVEFMYYLQRDRDVIKTYDAHLLINYINFDINKITLSNSTILYKYINIYDLLYCINILKYYHFISCLHNEQVGKLCCVDFG